VLGLAIVFLLVINIAAMVLLRMATMILKPVDQLVYASRQLAMERFDYRVDLGGNDEFDELAAAFNNLGSQLQANEQKKVEVLSQVALTLNHELNNAIAIIELQLNLLSRQTGGNAAHERRLREIHQSLARMTDTVQSLKNVRRIVLTDYVSGQKMLDLRRSVLSDESASSDAAPITTQPSQTPAPLAASAATTTRPAGQAVNSVPGSNGP
jgi:signal transduction histidine kinase